MYGALRESPQNPTHEFAHMVRDRNRNRPHANQPKSDFVFLPLLCRLTAAQSRL